MELFRLYGTVDVNGTDAISQIKNIDAEGRNAAGGLGKMAQAALSVASGLGLFTIASQAANSIANMGKQAFLLNANLEQSTVAFSTFLGGARAANEFIQDMRDFASVTPFTFTELESSTKRLLAFKFEAQEILPMMTAIGDASAGLGKGAEGIARITMALGQIKAKGRVMGEEMLQLTEVGIPAWDMLAKAMGKSTAEVMKMGEQGKLVADEVIPLLIKGMEDNFGGMMEKQSKTALGLFSTFKDIAEMTTTTMGEGLFGEIKDDMNDLAKTINKLQSSGELQEWARNIGEALTTTAEWGGKLIPVLIGAGTAWGTYYMSTIAIPAQIKRIDGVLTDLQTTIKSSEVLMAAFQTRMLGVRGVFNAITEGRAIITVEQQMRAMAAAEAEVAAATKVMNSALSTTAIGLAALAIGGVISYMMLAENETEKLIEIQKKSVAQNNAHIKVIEAKISTNKAEIESMESLKEKYLAAIETEKANEKTTRSNSAAKAELITFSDQVASKIDKETRTHINSTSQLGKAYETAEKIIAGSNKKITASVQNTNTESAKAKGEMITISSQLSDTIGMEAESHIRNARNVSQAYEDALQARKRTAEQLENNLIAAAQTGLRSTNAMIQQTANRIEALQKESEAISLWSKVKVGFVNVSIDNDMKLKESLEDSLAGMSGKLQTDAMKARKRERLAEIEENIKYEEELVNRIKGDDTNAEIQKLTAQVTDLLSQQSTLNDLVSSTAKDTDKTSSNTSAAASKAGKAAEDAAAARKSVATAIESISTSAPSIIGNASEEAILKMKNKISMAMDDAGKLQGINTAPITENLQIALNKVDESAQKGTEKSWTDLLAGLKEAQLAIAYATSAEAVIAAQNLYKEVGAAAKAAYAKYIEEAQNKAIAQINKLGDAVQSALTSMYQEQKQLALKAVDDSVSAEQTRVDKVIAQIERESNRRVKAYQKQIDAIDALTAKEDEEASVAKNQARIRELQTELEEADSSEERQRIAQELSDAQNDIAREAVLKQRELTKKALQDNIDSEQEASQSRIDSQKKSLASFEETKKAETAAIEKQYAEILKKSVVFEAARTMILNKDIAGITKLIKAYGDEMSFLGTDMGKMLTTAMEESASGVSIVVQGIIDQLGSIEGVTIPVTITQSGSIAGPSISTANSQNESDIWNKVGDSNSPAPESSTGKTFQHNVNGATWQQGAGGYVKDGKVVSTKPVYNHEGGLVEDKEITKPGPLMSYINSLLKSDESARILQIGEEIIPKRLVDMIQNNEWKLPISQIGSALLSKSQLESLGSQNAFAGLERGTVINNIDVHDNSFKDGTDLGHRLEQALKRVGV